MTIFYNIETGEYPRHEGDLKIVGWVENTTLPENWVAVENTEMPKVDSTKKVIEGMPEQYEPGKYKQKWIIEDLSYDERVSLLKYKKEKRRGILTEEEEQFLADSGIILEENIGLLPNRQENL